MGRGESDAPFRQPLPRAAGRGQAEGAAPAQEYGVNPFHPADRVEQVGFAGTGGTAAHGHAADGAVAAAEYGGAAGGGLGVGPVAGGNAGDIGDCTGKNRAGEAGRAYWCHNSSAAFLPRHYPAGYWSDAKSSSARSSITCRRSGVTPRLSRYSRSAVIGCKSEDATARRRRASSVNSRLMLAT